MTELQVGDRVRQGKRAGMVTIARMRHLPLDEVFIAVEDACRVRWDGNTYSQIADKRLLKKEGADDERSDRAGAGHQRDAGDEAGAVGDRSAEPRSGAGEGARGEGDPASDAKVSD